MKHRICLIDILLLMLALTAVFLLRRVDFSSSTTATSLIADMQRYTELNLDYDQVEAASYYILVGITTEAAGAEVSMAEGTPVMDADTDTQIGTVYKIEDQQIILFCSLNYTQFSASFEGGKTVYLDMPIRCRTADGAIEFPGTVTFIGYDL